MSKNNEINFMNIELINWITPNFISVKMPARKRQDGFKPDNDVKYNISDVSNEVLSRQCDIFRAEVFKKAGKTDDKQISEYFSEAEKILREAVIKCKRKGLSTTVLEIEKTCEDLLKAIKIVKTVE
jgi:hypothetical protein